MLVKSIFPGLLGVLLLALSMQEKREIARPKQPKSKQERKEPISKQVSNLLSNVKVVKSRIRNHTSTASHDKK